MMSEEVAVKVDNVSKTFRLPHEKTTTVKSLVINLGKGHTYEKQSALSDVSFEVKEGEFFGIVGRNGSGKSTLLKMLAGIYSPSRGSIQVNGKLTPFIELGVGFNPELTGRENVFLNGALLGFSRKEMDDMYDKIVEFAELERFMDQKLKNYSSGMQVRLAFSIAIRAESDILLIDEVLAVGDSAFQSKCFKYFRKLKKDKKTVVFVTHDMANVSEFCDRALLLDNGNLRAIGKPNDIASLYLLSVADKPSTKIENTAINEKLGIELIDVKLLDGKDTYTPEDTIRFKIDYKLHKNLKHQLGISIIKNGVSLHERNTKDTKLSSKPGKHSVEWEAPATSLNKGLHYISVAAFTDEDFKLIAYINEAEKFMIDKPKSKAGGLIDMKSEWTGAS